MIATEEIECEYKNKCADYPHLCFNCMNNHKKTSYYRPRYPPHFWYRPHRRDWELYRFDV